MIDAHCHLNFKAFENDIDKTIKKAFDAGIKAIINVGTSLEASKKAIGLAEKYENLYATVGIHPHHADKLKKDWEEDFEKLAKHPRVVAIGECGLDYFEYESNGIVDPKIQKEVFIKQIKIAHKLKLPLQIHNRHAGEDIIQIISDNKSFLIDPPGMFHCFSGDIEFLKKVLGLGFYIGFDGNITYQGKPKGEDTDLKDLVKFCPIDRLIVETDSPYLTPEPHRGSKNTPEYVIITGEFIAELKGLNFNEVNKITTNNAKSLFKLNL
ncbi:MAG: TatD family hydrolase [bacterium]|nr:TatD family hydrolase [bacterium]